jgi:signal transduction histidine kinase
MPTAEGRDTSCMRVFFRAHAFAAGALGLVILLGWSPRWFGTELVTRVFGAVLAVMAYWAAALSQIEDPGVRSTGTIWFAGGHWIFLPVLHNQRRAIWGLGAAETSADILQMVSGTVMLMTTEFAIFSNRPFLGWKFDRGNTPAEPQRSSYEQQIRAAGAQQEDRNRLARDLHDSIKQQIFVIQTAAATAQAQFGTDHGGAAAAIEQIRDSARDAMTEMEVMMDQLRSVPPENASLVKH